MRELTIIDLYDIFIDNIKVIIISVIVGVILSILYTTLLLKPMYESSTKIILVKPTTETTTIVGQTTGLTANDVALNQKLVSTYSEIIKSKKVLNEVITNLSLTDTADSISKNVTISPVKDSEVINITVLNADPNKAADIANEIINSFAKQVKEIYKIENVNQVDKAEPSLLPNNVSLPKNIMLFGIIALLLSYGSLFMFEYFKTTVKSPDDIEDTLGLTILAILPDLDVKE